MKPATHDDIRTALIEELLISAGSRRTSAAMVSRIALGEMDLPATCGERARELARRLAETRIAHA
ncbi:MAG: hypothetical protein QM820_07055 [Minicystis sp.]